MGKTYREFSVHEKAENENDFIAHIIQIKYDEEKEIKNKFDSQLEIFLLLRQ